jgi:DNA-binding GntR family transcriptional regulator
MRAEAAARQQGERRGGSVVESATQQLRDWIGSGRLPAGQRLVEANLMGELAISRGALRQALALLAGEGLLELVPHKGARVRVFNKRDLQEISDARVALEGMAARRAAARARIDPAIGNRLLELTSAMDEAIAARRLRTYIELNADFHNAVVESAGNAQLAAMINALRVQAFRHLFSTLVDLEDAVRSNQDHHALAEAISQGEEDRSEALMRGHINRSRGLIDRR